MSTIPEIPRIDAGTPVGTLVWWCHHEVPMEALWEPAGVRSAYIDIAKPEHERPVRHACFQVVKAAARCRALLAVCQQAVASAGAAYEQARAPAWAVYEQARADAGAVYEQAVASAGAAYWQARASALAAYRQAVAPAWAAYEQAKAAAWAAHEQAMAEAAGLLVALFREEYPELAHLVTDAGALVFPTEGDA